MITPTPHKVWTISFNLAVKSNIDIDTLPFHLKAIPYLVDMTDILFEKKWTSDLPQQPNTFFNDVDTLKLNNDKIEEWKFKEQLSERYEGRRHTIIFTDLLEHIDGGQVFNTDNLTIHESESEEFRQTLNSFSKELARLFYQKTGWSVRSTIKTYSLISQSINKEWEIF